MKQNRKKVFKPIQDKVSVNIETWLYLNDVKSELLELQEELVQDREEGYVERNQARRVCQEFLQAEFDRFAKLHGF